METQGQPTRYPNLSTADVFRAGGSTLAESPPQSPRTQLPAYGDEGAPPQYQEDGLDAKEKAAKAAKARRTLLTRLLTSVFVTVLVSLIVAAVVGRIHDRQAIARKSKEVQMMNMTAATTTEHGEVQMVASSTPTTTLVRFTLAADASPTATRAARGMNDDLGLR